MTATMTNTVTPDQNKQVVRPYVEAFKRGDLKTVCRLFTTDAVVQGVKAKAKWNKLCRFGVSWSIDWRSISPLKNMVAEADFVAVRLTERGDISCTVFWPSADW